MDCKFYLEALFGRKVDLVMKGSIKKRLRPSISGEVACAQVVPRCILAISGFTGRYFNRVKDI
jgi:hypothetical protein